MIFYFCYIYLIKRQELRQQARFLHGFDTFQDADGQDEPEDVAGSMAEYFRFNCIFLRFMVERPFREETGYFPDVGAVRFPEEAVQPDFFRIDDRDVHDGKEEDQQRRQGQRFRAQTDADAPRKLKKYSGFRQTEYGPSRTRTSFL